MRLILAFAAAGAIALGIVLAVATAREGRRPPRGMTQAPESNARPLAVATFAPGMAQAAAPVVHGPSAAPHGTGLDANAWFHIERASFAVLDLGSRVVYRLGCSGDECPRRAVFLNSASLQVETDTSVYIVELSGRVQRTGARSQGPGAIPPALPPPHSSHDGQWTFGLEGPGRDGSNELIVEGNDGRKFRLNGVGSGGNIGVGGPAWSPTAAHLALIGDYCAGPPDGGFDLFVFDPRVAALRNLTAGVEPVLGFAWSSDGHSIAFTTSRFDGSGMHRLAAVSVLDGLLEPIAEIRLTGIIQPVSTSADGDKVLLFLWGGTGFCHEGWQPSTTVEVLAP